MSPTKAQATQTEYDLRDLAMLMLKDQGITEGHWMLVLRFSHTTATIGTSDEAATPAVINRVTSIGISRVDEPNPISVDAAELAQTTS
jgi:hypothetical protein